MIRIACLVFCLALVAGCAAKPFSEELTEGAVYNLSVATVVADPEGTLGTKVVWGGRIVGGEQRQEGTVLEVLQLELDVTDRPTDADDSPGRFLLVSEEYLDTAVYEPGREITAVGRVTEIRLRRLDEIEYAYPVLFAEGVTLWPRHRRTIDDHYVPGWYDPYPYPYSPWFGHWSWGFRYYHH